MLNAGSLTWTEDGKVVDVNTGGDIIADVTPRVVPLAGGDHRREPDVDTARLFALAPDMRESIDRLVTHFYAHWRYAKDAAPPEILDAVALLRRVRDGEPEEAPTPAP